jgi:tetratricopeptide (TPR) repeat protein
VPEAPDPEPLARALLSALDIAQDAHFAQEDWEPALRYSDAILEVKQVLKRPAEDIALTRKNRANVLMELGRFGEAKADLEVCLQVFQNDPANRASVLNALAILFDKQGDVPQAILQQRRVLALDEQSPSPRDRAGSHYNLALYLERSGTPSALAESPRHQLAALIYQLVIGPGQDLQTSLHNYVILFRRAQSTGTPLTVPRVAVWRPIR